MTSIAKAARRRKRHEPDPDQVLALAHAGRAPGAPGVNYVASTMGGLMELDCDFSEFIASCVAGDVRFMIVGGCAVAIHRHPSLTKNVDVLGLTSNTDRLVGAIEDVGCRLDRAVSRRLIL